MDIENYTPDQESLKEFIDRVVQYKANNWNSCTWQDVADTVFEMTGLQRSEKWYRCGLYADSNLDMLVGEHHKTSTEESDAIMMLKMKKAEISDERMQVNAYYRALSREQTIMDIAREYAEKMCNAKPLIPAVINNKWGEKEAILQISDWHYGYDINNAWNEYNPEICRRRVAELLEATKERCRKEGVKTIHVVNLSDLIAGKIHLQIRIQSREEVISQTMDVSEILAEFLTNLSQDFIVEYYDCTDNHSRIEPNKKESIQLETLTRIIHWFLITRLRNNSRIFINENKFGSDIITFECLGHSVIGVHGDKDGATNVVDRLTLLTQKHYDLCLTAHRHHFFGDEKNKTIHLSNGSLCGVDDFALDHRLTSFPSQNLIVASADNVAEGIFRIVLE